LLVSPGRAPQWSPDGRYIAFVKDRWLLPPARLSSNEYVFLGCGLVGRCGDGQDEVWVQGKVRQNGLEGSREHTETGPQHVGHARGLEVLPEPLDEIQFRTVVRKPKDLQLFFDIFQVSSQRLGMVRRALIHYHDDPAAGPSRSAHQLLQEDLHAPSGLTRLDVVGKQSASIAERTEDRLLAIDAGRANSPLAAATHPGPGQMRMQVELRFILIPQFVIGVGIESPFFSRWSFFWARR
jgi:hypothetical protein